MDALLLVLQHFLMTLSPLLVVTPLSSGLVLPPPVKPGQDRGYRVGWPPEEPPEQA
jgi:hypothetical protein